MDLIWLENMPVLQVIVPETNFPNAITLKGNSSEEIWYAFVEIWASEYVGFPRSIRADREPPVAGEVFRSRSIAHRVDLKFSDRASHN